MLLPGANAYEVHELLPKFDCGQCGNPVCMTFARKLLLESQRPDECIFLEDGQKQKIASTIGTVDRERGLSESTEGEVVEIHPCTEEGMVTLWAQMKPTGASNEFLGDYFDQFQLCRSVAQADLFEKDECSPRMGYAYVEIKGTRTHIFKTGKIVMRRADSKEDAMATLARISRFLLPARVCSCSNIMADCFGGCCDDCFEDVCGALKREGDVAATPEAGKGTTMGGVLAENYENLDDATKTNFTHLGTIFRLIEKMVQDIGEGTPQDKGSIIEELDRYNGTIVRACTGEFLSNGKPEHTAIALTQVGLARDLIRASEGLLSVGNGSDKELYSEATGLLFDAYSAFENRDAAAFQDIKSRYETLTLKWREEQDYVGYAKVAANGFYISRILGKPVPDLSVFENDGYGI